MRQYISLLRGINVGGHKKIKMADLRRLYTNLGFSQVQSYVQSGNVIFATPNENINQLQAQIEAQIETAYGFHVPVLIRTPEQFARLLAQNPYSSAPDDNKHQYILFLDRTPTEDELQAVTIPPKVTDQFVPLEDALAIFYPKGAGRGKLTTNFFERKPGISGTMRNWRTVNKLFEKASS